MLLEVIKIDQFFWSQSLNTTQDLLIGPCSSKYFILRKIFMFIYFQITEGHVITYNLHQIVLLEFDIDQLDFFKGRSLYFQMAEIEKRKCTNL
jgi:hypothetical protein